ncbi:MAG TPA: tetraacyldisaccharide 4'-kinase [Burkholderiaceae bacterium]|nr:tetraacyldisaccharide 4'-kinase [Burkholderiaceae bacterium]
MSVKTRLIRFVEAQWQHKGIFSTLLLPFAGLTALFVYIKRWRYRHQKSAAYPYPPVIVVGNLVVGGTGKTPVVIALVKALQASGRTPGVISRGYGASIKGHAVVGQGLISPKKIGDEPALIANTTQVPVAAHPSRLLALSALCQQFPETDVVVSDDGLQHLALPRHIEIIVQDERGLGNERLLPAGPLREPASKLKQIDYLVVNCTAQHMGHPSISVGQAAIEMRLQPAVMHHLQSQQALPFADWLQRYGQQSIGALAAIGQPQRFFQMLEQAGLILEQKIALPDHDPLDSKPFSALKTELVLITAKDAIKCHASSDSRLWFVEPDTVFSDEGAWLRELADKLPTVSS